MPFISDLLSNLAAENICRAPHAMTSCAVTATTMWYFDNHTNECVSYQGCGTGYNDFHSKVCCQDSCPYGEFRTTFFYSKRVTN